MPALAIKEVGPARFSAGLLETFNAETVPAAPAAAPGVGTASLAMDGEMDAKMSRLFILSSSMDVNPVESRRLAERISLPARLPSTVEFPLKPGPSSGDAGAAVTSTFSARRVMLPPRIISDVERV